MIEKEVKMEAVKKDMTKADNLNLQPRPLIDDMTSPSASPPPPTASPVLAATGSPGGSPDDQNAPVMLTTMQPVPLNIMDLPKDYMSNTYVDDGRQQEFIYQVDGKNVEIVRQDDLPPGTVSVVVQQPGGLLPTYQTPSTTVLVLSELVEDISSVRFRQCRFVGHSRPYSRSGQFQAHYWPHRTLTQMFLLNVQNGKESYRALFLPGVPVGVGQGRMSEALPGGGGGEHYYYEHPLTAATTAMLNISSSANDEPNGAMSYVYEYYKLPPMPQDKNKLAEIWPATSSATGIASQTKTTNGLAGGELAPPIGDLQGLFLHGQQLKREPEDLSHHRKSPSDLDGGIIKGARQKVLLVTPGGEDLVVDVVNNNSVKDGLSSPQHGSRSVNGTPTSTGSVLVDQPVELIATADGLKPAMSYSTQIFSPMANATHSAHSGTPSPNPYNDHAGQYTTSSQGGLSAGYITTSSGTIRGSASSAFTVSDPYYREYFSGEQTYVRQQVPVYADSPEGAGGTIASGTSTFVDRYVRGQNTAYHSKGVIAAAGLTVDLPSPDSGIGADTVTPRDQTQIQQSFDYTDLCQAGILSDQRIAGGPQQSPGQGQGRSRPWHDFGRQNDADKIQIPKIYSNYGFKYHLETPISTSQRREDDRITYINKGQFYGITLDYIPDPDKPLKSQTVKSIVMLMFREEKSPEDEIKAWQFWHGRQHSVKQRILDADTKNSVGLIGCIEEVSHNAIAVYWNPLESSAKINVAVQCLSTDFSSQKGVKGLPLHLQIDTYEDPRDGPVYHRGYCQIKVFCDKGAERKTRDEERRAAKRKMTATGRKKIDELYHPACERSEFYSMSDLSKPPVLFSPAEDSIDKFQSQMDLQNFYGHDPENGSLANGESNSMGKQSPYLMHSKPATTPTLKFHNHFPPEPLDKKDGILDGGLTTDGTVFSPPLKRPKIMSAPPHNERVMLYVRQDGDEVYTPLHVVPPTTQGLLNAIENKYKISASNISNLYRKNRKGITVKIDDDMLKYYCNEDLFLMDIRQDREESDMIEITLIELIDR